MPARPWDTPEFWAQKTPLLVAAARRWGRPDHREAISTVWLKLMARFPDGVLPGPNPVSYLDRTIWAEADKFFRHEVELRTNLAGRLLRPIGPSDDRPSRSPSPEDESMRRERDRAVERLLRDLPEQDRRLIEAKYGVAGDAVPTKDIAVTLRLTRQAVGKRHRRVVQTLRSRAGRDGFAA
jgi:RNA polymerase sigma factor (sigma-70 family)